jgi:CheY-like chemotaxis protein
MRRRSPRAPQRETGVRNALCSGAGMPTRVLVVDDSPTVRRVVSGVLQRGGFEVVQAEDGQRALDHLMRAARAVKNGNGETLEPVDVVLVDFVMPRMNGFQLCRAMRNSEDLRAIPVVLMSAKSDRIRDHFVQQTGAIDAITKPFEGRALLAVIESAMRRAEQWRSRTDPSSGTLPEDIDGLDAPRSTPSGGVPRVALSGDLSIIPIGAVLQLLQIEAQSGILVASDGRTEVTMVLRQGLIDLVQARGAVSEFRLGRYFVELGLVTPEDIDRLLRDRPRRREATSPGRRRLGDLLVDSGRVTPDQLRDALARQSSELVYDVLRWPRGGFVFRREPPPPLAESACLGLPVASVVMEGFRRVDEWRLVEAGLGSFDAVLAKNENGPAPDPDELTKGERKLLDMVDGERTVRAIVEQSHMSSFDACRGLLALIEADLVRRVED